MVDCTFNKQKRLLEPSEYQKVFDAPLKKIHSQHLLLFVATGQTQARLGLAITKKKLKLAVSRNHLKRLSREYFRLNAHQLGAVDVVLIVKKGYDKKTDLHEELSHIFRELVRLFAVVADGDDC